MRAIPVTLAALVALPVLLTAQDSTADVRTPKLVTQLTQSIDSVEARYVAHRANPHAAPAELIAEDDTLAFDVASTLNALSVLGGPSMARLSGPHLAQAVGHLVFILRRTMDDRNARADALISSCSGRR